MRRIYLTVQHEDIERGIDRRGGHCMYIPSKILPLLEDSLEGCSNIIVRFLKKATQNATTLLRYLSLT